MEGFKAQYIYQSIYNYVILDSSSFSLQQLKIMFSKDADRLLHPLPCDQDLRNASDRERIQQSNNGYMYMGKNIELSKEIQTEILKLSDEYKLNESMCFQYWYMASSASIQRWLEEFHSFPKNYLGNNIPFTARVCYYTECILLLQSLNLLMDKCSKMHDDALGRDVFELLIQKNIGISLMDFLVKDIDAYLKGEDKQLVKLVRVWQQLIVDCLLQMYYFVQMEMNEMEVFITLMQKYSMLYNNELSTVPVRDTEVLSNYPSMGNTVAKPAVGDDEFRLTETYQILISLLLTFSFALQKDLVDKFTLKHSVNNKLQLPDVVSALQGKLKNTAGWNHKGAHGVALLNWFIFLNSCGNTVATGVSPTGDIAVYATDTSVLESIISCKTFGFMSEIIRNVAFMDSELQAANVGVWLKEILLNFIKKGTFLTILPIVENVADSGNDKQGNELVDIVAFIANLIDKVPDISDWFWAAENANACKMVLEKVSNAAEKNNDMFKVLLRLLAALAKGSEHSAEATYYFVNKISVARFSWNYFFYTLQRYPGYFSNQEVRAKIKVLAPQEVDGIVAILKLIQSVAAVESVRVMMYQNQQWLIVQTLFNLLSCPICTTLKGALMKTIAMFGRSKQLAMSIWQNLEDCQVLVTHTTPKSQTVSYADISNSHGGAFGDSAKTQQAFGAMGGIRYELEQVESLDHLYPSSCGFVALLHDLIVDAKSLPCDLGSGMRHPGPYPYLDFVTQQLFMHYDTRQYKHESEKYYIASGVLSMYLHMLREYTKLGISLNQIKNDLQDGWVEAPMSFGSETQTRQVAKRKTIGFQLMVDILTDSPLLRKILDVLLVDDNDIDALQGSLLTVSKVEFARVLRNKGTLDKTATANAATLKERSVVFALELLLLVLRQQATFITYCRQSTDAVIPVEPLGSILLRLSHRYITNIVLYTAYNRVPYIGILAANVLRTISLQVSPTALSSALRDSSCSEAILKGFSRVLQEASNESDSKPNTVEIKNNSIENARQRVQCLFERDTSEEESSSKSALVCRLAFSVFEILIHNLKYSEDSIAQYLLGFSESGQMSTSTNCMGSIIELASIPSFILSNAKLAEACFHVLYCLCRHAKIAQATMNYLQTEGNFVIDHLRSISQYFSTDGTDERFVHISNIRSCILGIVGRRLHFYCSQSPQKIPQIREEIELLLSGSENEMSLMIDLLYSSTPALAAPSMPHVPSFTTKIMQVAESCAVNNMADEPGFHSFLTVDVSKFAGDLKIAFQGTAFTAADNDIVLGWASEYNLYSRRIAAEKNALASWNLLLEVILVECRPAIGHNSYITIGVLFKLLVALLQNMNRSSDDLGAPVHSSELMVKVAYILIRIICSIREISLESNCYLDTDQSCLAINAMVQATRYSPAYSGDTGSARITRKYLYTCILHFFRYVESYPSNSKENILSLKQVLVIACTEKVIETICHDAEEEFDTCICMSMLEKLLLEGVKDAELSIKVLCSQGYLKKYLCIFRHLSSLYSNIVYPMSNETKERFERGSFIFESTLALFIRLAQHSKMAANTLVEYGIMQHMMDSTFLPRLGSSSTEFNSLFDTQNIILPLWTSMLRLLSSLCTSLSLHRGFADQVCDFLSHFSKRISGTFKEHIQQLTPKESNIVPLDSLRTVVYLSHVWSFAASFPNLLDSKLGASKVSKFSLQMNHLLYLYGAHIPLSKKVHGHITTRQREDLRLTFWTLIIPSNPFEAKNHEGSDSETWSMFELDKLTQSQLLLCNLSKYARLRTYIQDGDETKIRLLYQPSQNQLIEKEKVSNGGMTLANVLDILLQVLSSIQSFNHEVLGLEEFQSISTSTSGQHIRSLVFIAENLLCALVEQLLYCHQVGIIAREVVDQEYQKIRRSIDGTSFFAQIPFVNLLIQRLNSGESYKIHASIE